MPSAPELRAQFRQIPKDTHDANRDFSIRVWRALSWLERSEQMDPTDSCATRNTGYMSCRTNREPPICLSRGPATS